MNPATNGLTERLPVSVIFQNWADLEQVLVTTVLSVAVVAYPRCLLPLLSSDSIGVLTNDC